MYTQIAFGFLGWPMGVLLKYVPESSFPEDGNKESDFSRPGSSVIKIRRREKKASREISYNSQ
jgi:hypothetical protein